MPTPRRTPARKAAAPDRIAPERGRIALEMESLRLLRTIFGSARVHDVEVRRRAGIPGSQLWALAEIARGAGLSVNGLAASMALHQTTASNLVNALVERKLIRRVRDRSDQRIVHLHVAAEGQRLLRRAPGPHNGLLLDAIHRLDATGLRRLRQSLTALAGMLYRTAGETAGEPLLG